MELRRVVAEHDPALEPYRAVRDRDLTGRPGRFIAEGQVVVEHLLGPDSRFRAESVLVSEGRLAALEPALRAAGVPVLVADRATMDSSVGFPIHRGILAVGLRGEPATLGSLLPPAGRGALAIVLVGTANHDNVGAVFRNAAAFGADLVALDAGSCDPLYRKAIRVSVGTALLVPFCRGGSADAILGELVAGGFVPVALSPRGGSPPERFRWPRRTALVVGTEGAGLPEALRERLLTVSVPMQPGFDSLNLATATGIALHAIWSEHGRGD